MDPAVTTARLLAAQAPELAGLPLQALPGGQDNAVVRIGDALAARLPRHELGAQLLANELRWAPQAWAAVPAEVPECVRAGEPDEHFGFPWAVVRWVPGETADVAPYDPDRLAARLVDVLRALDRAAPDDAPANPYRDVPLAQREEGHAAVLAELAHPRAAELSGLLRELAQVRRPAARRWVHGDLHPRNVVVRGGTLAGVIDWGDVHAGDPAVDLASAWMLLPPAQRDDVRAALGCDDDRWARSRGWALVLAVLFLRIGRTDRGRGFTAVGERTLAAVAPQPGARLRR